MIYAAGWLGAGVGAVSGEWSFWELVLIWPFAGFDVSAFLGGISLLAFAIFFVAGAIRRAQPLLFSALTFSLASVTGWAYLVRGYLWFLLFVVLTIAGGSFAIVFLRRNAGKT